MSEEKQQMDGKEQVYVRYRVKTQDLEAEMEARGSQEHCDKNTLAFFSGIAPIGTSKQLKFPMPIEKDTPLLDESNGATVNAGGNNGNSQNQKPQDLVSLYLELFPEDQPTNQYEVICFVTDFYKANRERAVLTLEDYREAYAELKRAVVEQPEELRSSIKNTRTRNYLYSPERGKFALTAKGEKLVKELKSRRRM